MLVRFPPVVFSFPSHGVPRVKLRILENFTLYLRNSWSLNLRAIESCICGLRPIERKMRSILRTVWNAVGAVGMSCKDPIIREFSFSPKKSYRQKKSKIHKMLNLHSDLPITFFRSIFFSSLQQIRSQHKILHFLIPHTNFNSKKCFGSY
jgi:hypothetical protein